MAPLQKALREVIDVVLHAAHVGVKKVGNHEDAMSLSGLIGCHGIGVVMRL